MLIDDNSIRNWLLIPEDKRRAILDDLRGWIGLLTIKDWAAGGLPSGFHTLGGGMAIRNRMRRHLHDQDLPPTRHGLSFNWDDYYLGAIAALIDEQKP
jgi:hypothetical protein